MYRIRRFGIIKTATIVAVMYMLVTAVFFVPIAIVVVALGRGDSAGAGMSFVVFSLVAVLLYGALGWVFTAIGCAIYNVAAGWVGGIEVQVESVAPPSALPAWGPTGTTLPPPPTV